MRLVPFARICILSHIKSHYGPVIFSFVGFFNNFMNTRISSQFTIQTICNKKQVRAALALKPFHVSNSHTTHVLSKSLYSASG